MNNLPLITIAICTYNRADYLKDTLQDLCKQNAPFEDFEVLVVNNNCTDHTEQVCENFTMQCPQVRFRSVTELKQGLSHARNCAANEAISGFILYIDDDVILPQTFVSSALSYLKKYPEAECAGGRIFVSFDGEEPDWIPGELMPMFGRHDLGDNDKLYSSSNFPRGGNMLINKEIFQRFGGFDIKLGRIGSSLLGSEEKAFFKKVRNRGVKLYYWADLLLWHRISPKRLEESYLKNQSIGIGKSERLRVKDSVSRTIGKLASELIKTGGSLVLALIYLLRGKTKASKFLLKFRVWVMKGFLKSTGD